MPDEMTPSPEATAARTEIATLKADPAFARTFASADPAVSGPARARVADLHKAAFPDTPVAAPAAAPATLQLAAGGRAPVDNAATDAARAEVAAMKADPAFMARWRANEGDARAKLADAIKRGHPGDLGDGKRVPGDGGEDVAGALEGVPSHPAQYQFQYDGREVDPAFDRPLRMFCFHAQMDNSLARTVHEAHMRASSQQGERPTEASVEIQARTTEAQLRKLWGDETYETKIGAARALLKALPRGAYGWWLQTIGAAPGLGNDPIVIARLAAHAEQLSRR